MTLETLNGFFRYNKLLKKQVSACYIIDYRGGDMKH